MSEAREKGSESGAEIMVGADHDAGKVVIQFEEPLKWIAFGADDALRFIDILLAKIEDLELRRTQKLRGDAPDGPEKA